VELDSLDFGTLCHAAFEAFGKDPALRDGTDPGALRKFLSGNLDANARARFGSRLPIPLVVQVDSARQRLSRAAEVQVEERLEGWVIEQSERSFSIRIGALDVTGKIDRVERQESTGRVRVLDYKTTDKAASPAEAHWRPAARNGESAPEFARFTIGEKKVVWKDLQLPLYMEAMSAERGGPAVSSLSCGYFNLPKAAGETRLEIWEDYSAEIHAAAVRCAEGVARAVSAGIFWPPAELQARDESDEFIGLFHHGAEASVDPAFAEETAQK
jgi:ATP-dependent helicase/nuclease subunit B